MILNEEMRAEMTLYYSLEPQVHRQKRGWREGIPVGLSLSLSLFFFFFSSANLFYKCALLGLTMQFIPRNYFCLKTGSHFNSDCELL